MNLGPDVSYPPSPTFDDAADDPDEAAATAAEAPLVPLGQTMPQVSAVPVLSTPAPAASSGPLRHSMLAHGLSFSGSAVVEGSLTIAGQVTGQVDLPAPAHGHLTITETGSVDGDVRARNISVLGRTNGLLDAAGGKVSLHDSASVSGRIRYTHLQVNGADLNAQLERVRPDRDEPAAS